MNAIGLQNPGIDLFCKRDIPFLKKYDTKIIVNVCGHAPEEYLAVVERLADEPIDMMEINISCPNVNAGFLAFGQDAKHVEELTAQIKKIAKQPIIMKLTPNVTDITEIAKAAETGGADALSLINTLTGMKIDINQFNPTIISYQAITSVGIFPRFMDATCDNGIHITSNRRNDFTLLLKFGVTFNQGIVMFLDRLLL